MIVLKCLCNTPTDTIEKNRGTLKEESRWLDGLKSRKNDVQSHDQEKKSNHKNRTIEMSKDLFYYNEAVFGIFVQTSMRGHGGRVLTHSPPTSEAGVRFMALPQVGKQVVACRLQYRTLTNCMYWFPLPFQLPIVK